MSVSHHDTAVHHPQLGFLRKYIFSEDHKIIGIQFLISALIFLLLGGALALMVRLQLGFPHSNIPIIGKVLFPNTAGRMDPDSYNMLFTMHASVMIFFVIIPLLTGAFGNFLIPLTIGAPDMAFPKLNMMSYWFMWPAFIIISLSFSCRWVGPPPPDGLRIPLSQVPPPARGTVWNRFSRQALAWGKSCGCRRWCAWAFPR